MRSEELQKEIEESYFLDGKCMFDEEDTNSWISPGYLELRASQKEALEFEAKIKEIKEMISHIIMVKHQVPIGVTLSVELMQGIDKILEKKE